MPNNNDLKSPENDVESSPIKNLFRKNEGLVVRENNDNDLNNTTKKQNIKTSTDNKEATEFSQKVSEQSVTDTKTNDKKNNFEIKSKPEKEEKYEGVSDDDANIKSDNENHSDINFKFTEFQQSDIPEESEVSIKGNIRDNKSDDIKNEIKQKSVFSRLKSKLKGMVNSIKQQPEEYYDKENEIKDIFSDINLENEAKKLSEIEYNQENVIYSAPKKDNTQQTETVLSEESKISVTQKIDNNDKDILLDIFDEKPTDVKEEEKSESIKLEKPQPNPTVVKEEEKSESIKLEKPQPNPIAVKEEEKSESIKFEKPQPKPTVVKEEEKSKSIKFEKPQPKPTAVKEEEKSESIKLEKPQPKLIAAKEEEKSESIKLEKPQPNPIAVKEEEKSESIKLEKPQPKPTVVKEEEKSESIKLEKPQPKPIAVKEEKKPESIKNQNVEQPKTEPGDDIKIIPWNPKNSKSNIDYSKQTNISPNNNAKSKINTYHYVPTNSQFVIMSGKFTKTVKSEYEEVVKFKKELTESKLKNKSEKTFESDRSSDKDDSKQSDENKQPQKSDIVFLEKNSPVLKEINIPDKKPIQQSIENAKPKSYKHNKSVELKEVPLTNGNEENPKSHKKKKSRSEKPKEKKSAIKNLFSDEEEYDPNDTINEIIEEKTSLDDYNEVKDAESINIEIGKNFFRVFVRSLILFITTILSIIMAVISQTIPSLFNETIRNGWLVYAIINFIIFAVSVIVSRVPIVNGIMPLRRFKGNSDTAVAVASFAATVQSITALFEPNIFVNGTLYIYTPLVILGLFLNSIGKLLIILRVHDNFSFLTKPNVKFAGKIYTDIRNAEKLTSGLPNGKPIIAYTKRSKFMSDFLKLSYAPDPSEDIASKIAPYTALVSIISGIAYGIMTRDFSSAVSSFSLAACITMPICCLLAINIPLKRLCRNSIKGGAMVTGYETVKQFCDTNAVVIDVSQLYPKGSVVLSGMKTFKESRINDAITYGAAIMFAVNGTMNYVFENIIQCNKDVLPNVDSVIYEDGKGLVGWIGGQRVLIGNRELLSAHNVKVPEKETEDKYRQMGNEVTYISLSGELIAMFILSYNPNREIIHELRNLEDNGVSFIVRTVDANITQEHIAEKFHLFFRCIKILPTGLGNICHEATSSVDERSRAYLATRGRISSFARAISGCIRIKSNVNLALIIQYVGIAIGIILVTLISFISGFEKLGYLEILLYMAFWGIATVVVPSIRK